MTSLINDYSGIIEDKLKCLTVTKVASASKVYEAMRYSLTAGGKRLRPILVLEFCRVCGGDVDKALGFACAVELIHTYSLIHDDMPCMDNDDYRRGKLSCHKVFGDDVALIAGDALQSLAFEAIATSELPADRIAAAVRSLSALSGADGMVGGQMIDISTENCRDADTMALMCKLKTSALIKASCELGCIAAGRFDLLEYADEFADNLGLAFQVRDDILDVTGTEKELGKKVGSDEKNNKITYVTAYGLDRAGELVVEYSEKAKAALERFDYSDRLKSLTDYLVNRNS